MTNERRGQLSLFQQQQLERIEMIRVLLKPNSFEMIEAIRKRHGNKIKGVRNRDLLDEFSEQNITTLEDSIRWSDERFGVPR